MSETVSSGVDDFIDMDEGSGADVAADMNSDNSESKTSPIVDSRRRLEVLLAERRLAKDIQEFDFDV